MQVLAGVLRDLHDQARRRRWQANRAADPAEPPDDPVRGVSSRMLITFMNRADAMARQDFAVGTGGPPPVADALLTGQQVASFRSIWVGCLREVLAERVGADARREQVMAELAGVAEQLKQSLGRTPAGSALVDRVLTGIRDDRLPSRVERGGDLTRIGRDLSRILTLTVHRELLLGTELGRERLEAMHRQAVADPGVARAWAQVGPTGAGVAELPEFATARPDGPDPGPPLLNRSVLTQLDRVISPRQGQQARPLPPALVAAADPTLPPAGFAEAVRGELVRGAFPFGLRDEQRRRAAALAWFLVDAACGRDRIRNAAAAASDECGPPGTGPDLCRVFTRAASILSRPPRSEPTRALVSPAPWDLIRLAAVLNDRCPVDRAADGWNEDLAAAVFADLGGMSGRWIRGLVPLAGGGDQSGIDFDPVGVFLRGMIRRRGADRGDSVTTWELVRAVSAREVLRLHLQRLSDQDRGDAPAGVVTARQVNSALDNSALARRVQDAFAGVAERVVADDVGFRWDRGTAASSEDRGRDDPAAVLAIEARYEQLVTAAEAAIGKAPGDGGWTGVDPETAVALAIFDQWLVLHRGNVHLRTRSGTELHLDHRRSRRDLDALGDLPLMLAWRAAVLNRDPAADRRWRATRRDFTPFRMAAYEWAQTRQDTTAGPPAATSKSTLLRSSRELTQLMASITNEVRSR